jgi:hypothetical protein
MPESQVRNRPGFDIKILRQSGIWGAEDEAVLNDVHKKEKIQKNPLKKNVSALFTLAPRVESLMSRVYVLGHVGNSPLTFIGILFKNLQLNLPFFDG